ncbi:M1 family metallopeptidase [Thioalkalivibrio halophilus]|uniref:Aminopeptidase n=1 Tax=Thioalkalivibrio halophilus TaxID=252474 RepID=A0A1V2ZWK8_9GAMM|nr:aminopeptidase [Thioalkalivibrio halophilus]OOC09465.1 aminopeptidase [Thioalkalivibrio halophilus]
MARLRRTPGHNRPGTTALVCLLSVPLAGWAAPVVAGEPPARELTIELFPAEQRLQGRLSLPAAMLEDADGDLRFRFARGLRVDTVERGGHALNHEHSDAGYLQVTLDGDGDVAGGPLVIEYRARLQAPEDAGPGGGFLGAAGGFLPAGADWYPRRPEAEPASVRLEVLAADGHRVVASGSWRKDAAKDAATGDAATGDAEGVTRAVFEHPGGRALALASGPWEEGRSETADGVEVRTLFPAELEDAFGATYREKTVEYLERFSDRIGPYAFDSFTVAASPAPVGLAFSGFTLLGERVIPLPFIPHTSLGHEVLHNWWGTGVYADRRQGNWTEGLTTFMADYRFAEERGEARDERGQWLRDYAALPAGEDYPHGEFVGGNAGADRIAGYHRGAMLWRMLEDRIGEAALHAGLADFYAEYRHREAGWPELIAAVDAATEDDLEPFFEQWIGRAGAPRLALENPAAREDADGWRVTARLAQADTDHPWRVRVPLVVEFAEEDGRETHWVDLEEAAIELELELSTDARPARIAVDPDWRVFRHLAAEECPRILREAELDPATRVIPLGGASPAELAPWLGRVPETADPDTDPDSDSGAGAEAPRVLLGSRAAVAEWLSERGLPTRPQEVHADTDDLPDAGSDVEALAWTVPETGITVIAADSPGERRALAGALRHRAQESYLLQDDGEPVARGLWPVPGPWRALAD